jgi:hypothetical protein
LILDSAGGNAEERDGMALCEALKPVFALSELTFCGGLLYEDQHLSVKGILGFDHAFATLTCAIGWMAQ